MNRVDKSIVVNHMVNMVNSVKMLIFSIFYNNVDVKTDSYLNISKMYLLYNLMNRVEEIRIKAGGSTYLEISKSVFRNFDIICPSFSIVSHFQKEAHGILDSMKSLAKQIRLLTEARNRLLPKLMSGEIEV